MSRKLLFQIVSLIALLAMLAACAGQRAAPRRRTQAAAAEPTAAPAAAEPTAAPAAAAEQAVNGKFYWVQSSAWHPVHQYTQQGFLAAARSWGGLRAGHHR